MWIRIFKTAWVHFSCWNCKRHVHDNKLILQRRKNIWVLLQNDATSKEQHTDLIRMQCEGADEQLPLTKTVHRADSKLFLSKHRQSLTIKIMFYRVFTYFSHNSFTSASKKYRRTTNHFVFGKFIVSLFLQQHYLSNIIRILHRSTWLR